MQPTTDEIFAALRTCRAPEMPVNLANPGLVHGTEMAAPHNAAAPMQYALQIWRGVHDIIGWCPAWYSGLICEEGRRQLQPAA